MKIIRENMQLLILIVVVLTGFGVSSISGEVFASTAKTVHLKFSEIPPPGHPIVIFGEKFAEIVAKKTNGAVQIKVYPSKILAGYGLEPIQSGITDFGETVPGVAKSLIPWIDVVEAPYLISDRKHFVKIANPRGPFLKTANEIFKKHNLVCIGLRNYGVRDLTFKDRPIYSPSDLRGAKLRVVPTPVWIKTWKTFGATPIPMPSSEMATALLTGTVEGQENSWHDIAGYALYDVQKYIMRTNHLLTFCSIFMNLKSFQSLSPEQQVVLMEALVEGNQWYEDVFTPSKMAEYEKLFVTKGMKIIGPKEGLKREEFVHKSKEVFDFFKTEWGDWADKIIEMGKTK